MRYVQLGFGGKDHILRSDDERRTLCGRKVHDWALENARDREDDRWLLVCRNCKDKADGPT